MAIAGPEEKVEPVAGFYAGLPVFGRFGDLTDPGIYTPLPDGWVLGLADIVRSTDAIAAGRYKEVNTAAASVIAAVSNRLGPNAFPFVFGGDGASFALPESQEGLAREALAAVAAWVRDAFGLDLRVALVPVAAVRAAGHDVRIARFAASPDVAYAMFSGGGLAWAEERMKAGDYAIAPAAPGTLPDLTGLSCRFDEIPPERGTILSLIVVPGAAVDAAAFNDLVAEVLRLTEDRTEAGRPLPDSGPVLSRPLMHFELEAKALAARSLVRRARLAVHRLISFAIFARGRPVGRFDPAHYRRQLVENTDFRKYDDGLRMTLDATPALADRLEALLQDAQEKGVVRYGLHRQGAALMTCIVPSPFRSDHIHFVDGARGGYAMAAQALKGGL